MSQLNITQLLGIWFPTDICCGDVKQIPNYCDIHPNPWLFTAQMVNATGRAPGGSPGFAAALDKRMVRRMALLIRAGTNFISYQHDLHIPGHLVEYYSPSGLAYEPALPRDDVAPPPVKVRQYLLGIMDE